MTALLKTLFIIILICISIAGILFICAVIGTMLSFEDDYCYRLDDPDNYDYEDFEDFDNHKQ